MMRCTTAFRTIRKFVTFFLALDLKISIFATDIHKPFNQLLMKKLFHTLIVASLCLLVTAPLNAQKKPVTKKRTASTIATYPQRDAAFKSDYKLTAIGTFNPNDVQSLTFTPMPALDFNGHVLKRNVSRKQVRLTLLSCRENQIIDEEEWLERNGLTLRETRIEYPMEQYKPRFSYSTGGYLITTYGENWGNARQIVITDEAQKTLYAAYDFENWKFSPKTVRMGNTQTVHDFIIEGNILYIAHGTNGYSDGAGYQTGYITAFDMENNEIIWTTQPMSCNSGFDIVGNSIICGYGFTSEPDYLFVLDKYSGQRIHKIPLKKKVDYVVPKGDKAYVRTYSYDYVFRIQ